jgi:hypothetical protein
MHRDKELKTDVEEVPLLYYQIGATCRQQFSLFVPGKCRVKWLGPVVPKLGYSSQATRAWPNWHILCKLRGFHFRYLNDRPRHLLLYVSTMGFP